MATPNDTICQVASALIKAKRVLLASHVNPDGDAIGSLTALAGALSRQGKEARIFLPDGIPATFAFLEQVAGQKEGAFMIDQNDLKTWHEDIIVLTDVSDWDRTSLAGYRANHHDFSQMDIPLIVIDHHLRGDLAALASIYYHQPDCSSTCEMVYDILKKLPVKITPAIATALFTGTYTDTGGFQFANTNQNSYNAAADLLRQGAKLRQVVKNVFHPKTIPALKLTGRALRRLRLTFRNKVACSYLTWQDIVETKASPEDIIGIINQITSLNEPEISLLLIESQPGSLKGTLRTSEKSHLSIGRLAKLLGGGGHPRAAGFTVSGRVHPDNQLWNIIA